VRLLAELPLEVPAILLARRDAARLEAEDARAAAEGRA
jgi:hypothetical protein